jgi:hypothetical protein
MFIINEMLVCSERDCAGAVTCSKCSELGCGWCDGTQAIASTCVPLVSIVSSIVALLLLFINLILRVSSLVC